MLILIPEESLARLQLDCTSVYDVVIHLNIDILVNFVAKTILGPCIQLEFF